MWQCIGNTPNCYTSHICTHRKYETYQEVKTLHTALCVIGIGSCWQMTLEVAYLYIVNAQSVRPYRRIMTSLFIRTPRAISHIFQTKLHHYLTLA